MHVPAGLTDVSISIYCRDSSGAELTGKAAADFSLTYRRDGAKVAISLSDLTALTDAHTDGGIYEVGNGEYRLDLPDAAVATGANQVSVQGTVSGGTLLSYPIDLGVNVTRVAGTVAEVGTAAPTAEAIADQVWDEAKSEHTTAGTFGLWLGTKLWNWLGALMGKTADAATRAEINATTAGAGYNETTDSLEARQDDKAGYSLAATGLDAITATEPTGKPTTFPGWIMWLVQRFRRSTKSATEIVVKTEAGATVTTQAITASGSDQTLGPPS